MKAILYRRYGPPEVLEYAEVPEPTITDRQILVKVHAASVNPADWKLRRGRPRIPLLKFPRIPGSDIAGKVVQVGKAVTRFKVGDSVYGMIIPFSGGTCAEYAAVPEKNTAIAPRNLSLVEAAAVPAAAQTALQALRDHGKIKSGDRVLINGASGGVGSFAVQIAKANGAEVTAVTSGKNVDFVKGLGADRVVDYTTEDFTRTDSRYDIIFDTVSSRSFGECRPALKPNGVYIATLPSPSTILRMVTGAFFGGRRATMVNVWPRGADLEVLTGWIEAGKVRPHIDRIYPLPKTAEAHAYSEAGHVRGKLVIRVTD